MLGRTKKPLTNVVIDKERFLIAEEHKNTIRTIVKNLSVEGRENPFKGIESKLPSYAICLRGARTKEGVSQKELSKRTGIAITNISKMENGERKIGEKVAKKLSKALSVGYKTFL